MLLAHTERRKANDSRASQGIAQGNAAEQAAYVMPTIERTAGVARAQALLLTSVGTLATQVAASRAGFLELLLELVRELPFGRYDASRRRRRRDAATRRCSSGCCQTRPPWRQGQALEESACQVTTANTDIVSQPTKQRDGVVGLSVSVSVSVSSLLLRCLARAPSSAPLSNPRALSLSLPPSLPRLPHDTRCALPVKHAGFDLVAELATAGHADAQLPADTQLGARHLEVTLARHWL